MTRQSLSGEESTPRTDASSGEPELASQTGVGPYNRVGYTTYAMILLLLVQTFAYLDRSIIYILAEPIKDEFALADWQIGVLGGLAFALFYTTLGIPIARLAERKSRSRIIAASIGVWSLATIGAGLSRSFVQLAISRLIVGVGEAGCTPAAHSLISEVLPKARRAAALALYSAGIPVGILVGTAAGGFIADAYGWRMAFIWAGAPGLILAVLVWLTLYDPRNKHRHDAIEAAADQPMRFREAMRELMNKRVFWLVAIASGLLSLNGNARGIFLASFYLRNYSEQVASMSASASIMFGHTVGPIGFLGLALGISTGLFGVLGTIWGGLITDRWAHRDQRAYVLVPMWICAAMLPFGLGMLLASDLWVSLFFACLTGFIGAASLGPIYASVQSIISPRNRATAAALLLLIINLLGLAVGQPLLGALSDILANMGLEDGEGLRWSLIIAQISILIGMVLCWLASKRIRDEIVS